MAKKRKFCAYRNLNRPYTRKSKYRKLNFIRASPAKKIVKFNMGNLKRKFKYKIELITKSTLNIRDNAIESARMSSNRVLEKEIGTSGYAYRVIPYPHHVMRENPLAAGAGADRMSTGMKMSFGKPIGNAVIIKQGQTLIRVDVNKANIEIAKKAMTRAYQKLPCSCSIKITENN